MQSALVVVGDEILAGHTLDTNAHYLAGRLARLGVPLIEKRTVADQAPAIQGAIWELQERRDADVVLVCGGLGPTHDDRTIAAVADLHGVDLVLDASTWELIQQRARSRAAREGGEPPTLTAGARKMALVPRGAHVYANEAGAAPGVAMRRTLQRGGTAWTIIMPGVPQEMRALWQRHFDPLVVRLAEGRAVTRHVAELEYLGFESEVAAALERAEAEHPGIAIGSYPQWGQRRVVLRLTGRDAAHVEQATAALLATLQADGHAATRLPPAATEGENV